MIIPMNFIIRAARQGDLSAILAILEIHNFHHIPSPEMPDLDLRMYFVAESDGKIVGVAGYKILGPGEGKTQLMGVHPAYSNRGIGRSLHQARIDAMRARGVKRLITNCDDPKTIRWYQKHFGYRVVGRLAKVGAFGLKNKDHWTTLELRLGDPA